jgi:hypothetical protein
MLSVRQRLSIRLWFEITRVLLALLGAFCHEAVGLGVARQIEMVDV